MVPYLKGIHHTLESWRLGRNVDGWKYGTVKMLKWLNEEINLEGESLDKETITKSTWKEVFNNLKERHQGDAPSTVKPVGCLLADLKALSCMLEPKLPIH